MWCLTNLHMCLCRWLAYTIFPQWTRCNWWRLSPQIRHLRTRWLLLSAWPWNRERLSSLSRWWQLWKCSSVSISAYVNLIFILVILLIVLLYLGACLHLVLLSFCLETHWTTGWSGLLHHALHGLLAYGVSETSSGNQRLGEIIVLPIFSLLKKWLSIRSQ